MINFERPLVFVDIESTGVDPENDRIVEISFIIQSNSDSDIRTRRVNPGIPIPKKATEIHGIGDDDVKDLPTFRHYAKSIHDMIQGMDLAGFNSNRFDFPLLRAEFERAGIDWDYMQHNLIDVGNLFMIMEPRTLTAAMKFYCNVELKDAHNAEADALATSDVLTAMLHRYLVKNKTDMPDTVKELARFSNYGRQMLDLSGKFTYNDEGEIIFTFGKYRGEPAKDHIDFVDWMLNRAQFPSDTCKICEQLMEEFSEV